WASRPRAPRARLSPLWVIVGGDVARRCLFVPSHSDRDGGTATSRSSSLLFSTAPPTRSLGSWRSLPSSTLHPGAGPAVVAPSAMVSPGDRRSAPTTSPSAVAGAGGW